MAGIVNWFSFTSKEQREQHEKDYFDQMFPMGQEQKYREEELLAACIRADIGPNEKLYQLQIVKEALMQTDEKRKEAALKKWYNSSLAKKLPQQERAMLLALGELEHECSSMEKMPQVEDVRRRSEALIEDFCKNGPGSVRCVKNRVKKLFKLEKVNKVY